MRFVCAEEELIYQLSMLNEKNKNREVADKTFNVITLLSAFIEQMTIYLSGYEAYSQLLDQGYIFKKEFEAFGQLSVEAIEIAGQQELTRIFDNGSTCGKENCSLETLKAILLRPENSVNIPKGAEDDIITSIDKLYDVYNKVYSKQIRNTRIGHHDLKTLAAATPAYIDFASIRSCVILTRQLVKGIQYRIYGFAPNFLEYQEQVDIYKRQLMLVMEPKLKN